MMLNIDWYENIVVTQCEENKYALLRYNIKVGKYLEIMTIATTTQGSSYNKADTWQLEELENSEERLRPP